MRPLSGRVSAPPTVTARSRQALLGLLMWLVSVLVPGASRAEIPESVRQAETTRIEAIARASQATLAIFGSTGQGGGSGVMISPDGYALTNFHVAKPCGDYMRCGMADGKLYDAVVVGIDPTGDVALIKVLGRSDFPIAEMGDSDRVQVGDWCYVIGNPFLLATNLQPSVSYGIVSGVHRYQYPAGTLLEYADCLQTDAAINPGNSGGPLFDADGRLIGINGRGSFEKRGRVNVGVGYAISINQIKLFLGQLKSGRVVDHATLGAIVSSNEAGKAVVFQVLRSSDAYRRGLREGDEIVSFGGQPIDSANRFKNVLGIFPKGWRVPLSYRREGERFDVMVRLAGVHTAEELWAKIQDAPDPEPRDPKQPKDGKPERKPPLPLPGQTPAPMPDAVKALFQERKGYANYFFNHQNRERVWSAFQRHGQWQTYAEPWIFQGESGLGDVKVELGTATSQMKFGERDWTLDTHKDLTRQLGPDGSGGLLLSLHLWRRLLQQGLQEYGEIYYLGESPWRSPEERWDTLVGTFDVTETRFYFSPESGQLVGLEMYSDTGVDPCEVRFSEVREVAPGLHLPHRMTIQYGDQPFAEITWKTIRLAPE